jgi:predicted RNA binding protein YcfA (HicA-like mRNA interferase family)
MRSCRPHETPARPWWPQPRRRLKWGYKQVHQSGSHIVLDTEEPNHQRIAVPDHRSLRIGTLNSILRIVAAHKSVTRQEILDSL